MMELSEKAQVNTGIRYDDEIKEIAYQLWAFGTARNASEVARQLNTEQWDHRSVPRETVAYWAREYGWAERAARDVHSIAPDLRMQTFSELLFAGYDGAKYIRRVARGDEDHANIDDILNDETIDASTKVIRIESRIKGFDAARKARMNASIAAVDRIGFSPIGKGMPALEQPNEQPTNESEELKGKSADELMRAEQAYRQRKRER